MALSDAIAKKQRRQGQKIKGAHRLVRAVQGEVHQQIKVDPHRIGYGESEDGLAVLSAHSLKAGMIYQMHFLTFFRFPTKNPNR